MTPGGEVFNLIPVTIYGHPDGVTSLPSRSAALRSWHWPPQQTGSARARRRPATSQQTPHVTPPLSQFFLALKKNNNILNGERKREKTQILWKKPQRILRVL